MTNKKKTSICQTHGGTLGAVLCQELDFNNLYGSLATQDNL